MKILKFIGWWWTSLGTVNQWGIGISSTLVTSLIGAFLFGPKFLLAILSLALMFLFCIMIYAIYRLVEQKWSEYNQYLDSEQQEVVDRLRGYTGGIDPPTASELLAKIRKRQGKV